MSCAWWRLILPGDGPSAAVPHHILLGINLIIECMSIILKYSSLTIRVSLFSRCLEWSSENLLRIEDFLIALRCDSKSTVDSWSCGILEGNYLTFREWFSWDWGRVSLIVIISIGGYASCNYSVAYFGYKKLSVWETWSSMVIVSLCWTIRGSIRWNLTMNWYLIPRWKRED